MWEGWGGIQSGEGPREEGAQKGDRGWSRIRKEDKAQIMVVTQRQAQEEGELKEGDEGQKRKVLSGRGEGFREALRRGGHLR